MFNEAIYDLSRLQYREYNARYEKVHTPWSDKPGLFTKLLAALRNEHTPQPKQPAPLLHVRHADTGATR